MDPLLLVADIVIYLGALARLTRAVTVEDVGGRFLRWPARRWADRPLGWAAPRPLAAARRRWWADALSCPFCVSTHLAWIGLLLLVVAGGPGSSSPAVWVWRFFAAFLTASWVTAQISANLLGDHLDPEDDPDQFEVPPGPAPRRYHEPEEPPTTDQDGER